MHYYAQKAAKPAKKGGLSNLLFVVASADALPDALDGLISDFTIWFPWGSLLKAAVTADEQFLAGLKRLASKDARLHVLFSLEPEIEKKILDELSINSLNAESLDKLKAAYARHGIRINWRMVPQADLKTFPSTWAKKLAYGRPRPVVELVGRFS